MSDARDIRLGPPATPRPGALDHSVREQAVPQRQTLVEEGTTFKGVMTSTCPVVVRGAVEGEISGPSLQVSASGVVAGRVNVESLNSEGVLSGEFDADVVQLSGHVKDSTVIRARSIEVKLAPENGKMQLVFGECELEVGDAPSQEDAVVEALAERQSGNGRRAADSSGGDAAAAADSGDTDERPSSKKGKSKEPRTPTNGFPLVPAG